MEANKWKKRHHREKSRADARKLTGKPSTVTFLRSSERETHRSRPKTIQTTWPARSGIQRRTSSTILRGKPPVQVGSRDPPASSVRNPKAAKNGTNVLNFDKGS
jgi:hypothetical protein